MDWFISAVMVLFYFAAGNKWKYTWMLSFFINILWTYYAWDIGQYGLIPSSLGHRAVRTDTILHNLGWCCNIQSL